jgi:hypothetical protein
MTVCGETEDSAVCRHPLGVGTLLALEGYSENVDYL